MNPLTKLLRGATLAVLDDRGCSSVRLGPVALC